MVQTVRGNSRAKLHLFGIFHEDVGVMLENDLDRIDLLWQIESGISFCPVTLRE